MTKDRKKGLLLSIPARAALIYWYDYANTILVNRHSVIPCRIVGNTLCRECDGTLAVCSTGNLWLDNDAVRSRLSIKGDGEMKTFIEWSNDMERRYDTMPKWYFDHRQCKTHYLSYTEDWERRYTFRMVSTIDIKDEGETIRKGDSLYFDGEVYTSRDEAYSAGQHVLTGLDGGRAYNKALESASLVTEAWREGCLVE